MKVLKKSSATQVEHYQVQESIRLPLLENDVVSLVQISIYPTTQPQNALRPCRCLLILRTPKSGGAKRDVLKFFRTYANASPALPPVGVILKHLHKCNQHLLYFVSNFENVYLQPAHFESVNNHLTLINTKIFSRSYKMGDVK